MREIRNKLDEIVRAIPVDRPVIYLDYPVHLNFGDILIMLGTERFFADHAYQVAKRASVYNCTARTFEPLKKGATIVLHGGGNFGDLYPIHQRFREDVVTRYRDKKIVLLPQSVHFDSKEALETSARIFRQHPDLTLFVRDAESLELVKDRFTDKAFLMPDMAHSLQWPEPVKPGPTGDTLYLVRRDIEATGQGRQPERSYDWIDFIPSLDRKVFGLILRLHRLEARLGRPLGAQQAWYAYCHRLAHRMERLFAPYGTIWTSRLHGMIFSSLLHKQVVYTDNSYGKLSRYATLWLDSSAGISRADQA